MAVTMRVYNPYSRDMLQTLQIYKHITDVAEQRGQTLAQQRLIPGYDYETQIDKDGITRHYVYMQPPTQMTLAAHLSTTVLSADQAADFSHEAVCVKDMVLSRIRVINDNKMFQLFIADSNGASTGPNISADEAIFDIDRIYVRYEPPNFHPPELQIQSLILLSKNPLFKNVFEYWVVHLKQARNVLGHPQFSDVLYEMRCVAVM